MNERLPLVLWRNPITVIQYSSCELVLSLLEGAQAMLKYKASLTITCAALIVLLLVHNLPGTHQDALIDLEKYLAWCGWWVGLGILSSVGLGTGLHTFLLYLGPHIAAVTMAAYECGSTDFPAPPYPTQILCPTTQEGEEVSTKVMEMTVWAILSKVRVEVFCAAVGRKSGIFWDSCLCQYSQSPVRLGRDHVWTFSHSFLDFFRSNSDWESHHKNAHPKDFRDIRFQSASARDQHFFSGPDSSFGP